MFILREGTNFLKNNGELQHFNFHNVNYKFHNVNYKFHNIRHYSGIKWDSDGNECSGLSFSQTLGYSRDVMDGYIWRFIDVLLKEFVEVVYEGCMYAEVSLNDDVHFPVRCEDCNLIAFIVMRLIIKYGYSQSFTDGKFTIIYTLKLETGGYTTFTIGKSLSLLDYEGNSKPSIELYKEVYKLIVKKAEDYGNSILVSIGVRFYMVNLESREVSITDDLIYQMIWDLAPAGGHALAKANPMIKKNASVNYTDYITKLTPSNKERGASFIVADTETVIVDRSHVPYSIGFLLVRPGDNIETKNIYDFECYYSED